MAAGSTVVGGLSLSRLPLGAKAGVGALCVILVALAYWLVFFNEISAKIAAAERQSADLNMELARQQQAQASYLVDRDELVMRQQRQRELNKILPADTEAAAFLSSLQQVSNVAGIDLKALKPEDEQTQAFFAKVPMRLELSGRFHQIAKFFYEVGKLDRIINVENIVLGEPKQEGDDIVLKAKCLATAFHTLKPKPTPAAATSAQPGQPAQPGQQPTAQPGAPTPVPPPTSGSPQ